MDGDHGVRPIDLGVLGPLALRVHDVTVPLPARTERALLAALALRRGRTVPADRLAEDVWGDDLPQTWRKGVQVGVSRLRRRLADAHAAAADLVTTAPDGYALALAAEDLDASRLERAAEEGRRLLGAGDPDSAHATLTAGLALWRGTPFPELADRPAAQAEAARLAEIHAAATDRWHEASLGRGDVEEVVARLEAELVEDPLRERRWSLLMLALYRAGRQHDALRAFQRARTVLADELGLQPGPELRGLEAAILAHDPALAAATRHRLLQADRQAAEARGPVVEAGPAPDATGRPAPTPRRRDPTPDPLEWARHLCRTPRRGQAHERQRLLDAWRRVTDGRGGMLTLSGDPLSGKSRLAAELTLAAEADGALVLAGRCVPGLGLASFVGPANALEFGLDTSGLGPGSPAAFNLGLEVAALAYGEAARGRPVLAVLDDAHLADAEVINLFRHLAERPGAEDATLPAAALVIQRAGHPPPPGMNEWLAQGRRLPVHEHVDLAPLDDAAAVAVLRDRPGPAAARWTDDDRERMATLAGGRPGYLVELGLHSPGPDAEQVVPGTLRALVADHLAAQDADVQRVLLAAAVAGTRFDLTTACRAAGLDGDAALDALERATTARFLDEVASAPGEHAFCAEVDRLVLLDRLTSTRRAVIEERLAG